MKTRVEIYTLCMLLEECGSGVEGRDMRSGLGQGQMEKSEGLCCDGQSVSLI